jgi:hypothetical protein
MVVNPFTGTGMHRETVNRILQALSKLHDELVSFRASKQVVQGVRLASNRVRAFARLPGPALRMDERKPTSKGG